MNSPHLRAFAPCRVLLPRLAKGPRVVLGPTRANVAYRPGFPPAVGAPRKSRLRLARGGQAPADHGLFCLAGFSVTPRPEIEVT